MDWPKFTINQKQYPQQLRDLRDPPAILYYQGKWQPDLFKNCLAIVGTRRMSDYGQIVLERLIPPLIQAGITIVSGFMYGIDATAHRLCLDYGGRTIAVLGCGLNHTVPDDQEELRQAIVDQGGLVISELAPNHQAFPWTFVRRNRIIAALSQAVLIIEAGLKSGALITARRAFELKRPVLALPGPIIRSASAGCNWLIQQGAKLVTNAEDILTIFKLSPDRLPAKSAAIHQLSQLGARIIQLLAESPRTADELARELKKPIAVITSELTHLSLRGLIKEMNGRWIKC